jgi:predicted nucleotidyltransferase
MDLNYRKPIFKCRIGSHLYGTSTKDSDEDFATIFLPSINDLFGINNAPKQIKLGQKLSPGPKNTAGDVDDKAMSLQYFIDRLIKGDIACIEMLFAPQSMIIIEGEEFKIYKTTIIKAAVSKKSAKPFIGMAISGLKDDKDLSHKYRALYEAFDLLIKGKIEFPRPEPEAKWLIDVKLGKTTESKAELCSGLLEYLELVKGAEKLSVLRAAPDEDILNKICLTIMSEHFNVKLEENPR